MENWLLDVEQRYKRKNKILFTRESACLQPLISLMDKQQHRTLVLWAFDCMDDAIQTIEKNYPGEKRPSIGLEKCELWSQGIIKMPEAKKALLDVHAIAKEIDNPADQALCHAIGQGLATVHVGTHAIGLPFYELSAIVFKNGLDNSPNLIQNRVNFYIEKLLYYQEYIKADCSCWASFLQNK